MNALQIRVSKLRRALKAMRRRGRWSPVKVSATARTSTPPSGGRRRLRRQRIRDGASQRRADGCHRWRVRAPPSAGLRRRARAVARGAAQRLRRPSSGPPPRPPGSRLRLAALTERAQVALALGLAPVRWSATSSRSCRADPTLESLAGLLMVALYRSGRQADALDVYARTRDAPGRDARPRTLGLACGRCTNGCCAKTSRSAAGSDARRVERRPPRAATSVRRGAVPATPTNLPTVVRPLIGRDEQLDSLAELLDGVRLLSPGRPGWGRQDLARARRRGPRARGIPRWRVRGPAGLGHHRRPGAACRSRRARACRWTARRRTRHPRAHHHLPGPAPAAAAARQLRARRRRRRRPRRRHPGPLPRASPSWPPAARRSPSPTRSRSSSARLRRRPRTPRARQVLGYPAAQLFAERARAVRPGTVFDEPTTCSPIGRISRALDGIPLALELAAARVGVDVAGRDRRPARPTASPS